MTPSFFEKQRNNPVARGQNSVPDTNNIVFSFITIFLVPLLFFVLLELGLKIAGVGTSYDYFGEIDINGKPHYQENPYFADQFYPASLVINPRENTFTVERAPELIRVFILGGSAALGFPHKNHGLDRLLAAQLLTDLNYEKTSLLVATSLQDERDAQIAAEYLHVLAKRPLPEALPIVLEWLMDSTAGDAAAP